MRKGDYRAKIFLGGVVFFMGFVFSQKTFAQEMVQVKLAPVCCEKKYPVYGAEQPVPSGENCVVNVNLQTPESSQPVQNEPASSGYDNDTASGQAIQNLRSVPSSVSSAGESILSPLRALYSELESKKPLLYFANDIVEGHTEKYHAFLDENIFGKFIRQISDYTNALELSTFLEKKQADAQGCDAENPRPDCVIEFAMCSYEKYAGVLVHQTGRNVSSQATNTSDIQRLLSILQERDLALYQEVVHTYQALDSAIAVYSQFYQTYYLHLRFKEVIESLVKVRNMTSFMRTLVGCIPNKFVGVATTKCD